MNSKLIICDSYLVHSFSHFQQTVIALCSLHNYCIDEVESNIVPLTDVDNAHIAFNSGMEFFETENNAISPDGLLHGGDNVMISVVPEGGNW